MEFMTTQEAAAKWDISDRRVRILCAENKIAGAEKCGKSYRIPADAQKPADGRFKNASSEAGAVRYLKWRNDTIGMIDRANAVSFTHPNYNEVASLYTHGAASWTPEQFTNFLAERVVSRDRRDIERILFRCGLSHYYVQRIGEITRGIHPKDLLWILKQAGFVSYRLEGAAEWITKAIELLKAKAAV